jgi:phytoene synthase
MLSTTSHTWEKSLVDQARSALETPWNADPVDSNRVIWLKSSLLEKAYQKCEAITSLHSRTFHLASGLLPINKRKAVRALYAFCRLTDDLVDHPEAEISTDLESWRRRMLVNLPAHEDQIALAWADTRHTFQIPLRYAEQLVEGVARDIHQKRYETFDDLASYCYGVASTVGLMAMHIIGFSGPEAIPYAVKLGVALQLTNILRDVGEDWRNGRLYLPLQELHEFGLAEEDIASGQVDARWQAFMHFQLERNRSLYSEAEPGIGLLNPDGRFAIGAAAGLYRAILDEIEASGGDVFSHRAHVSTQKKLSLLPGIWLRSLLPARSANQFLGK